MLKDKDCQTARGNVRRGLFGDGRRTTPNFKESCREMSEELGVFVCYDDGTDELKEEDRKENLGGFDEVEDE